MTEGQRFAKEMRRYFGIGTCTRRRRKGLDLHAEVVEAILNAVRYDGFYSPVQQEAWRVASGAAASYQKHILGHRVRPNVRLHVDGLTAYQFCALLGRMVDAGVTNVGQGEDFFQQM